MAGSSLVRRRPRDYTRHMKRSKTFPTHTQKTTGGYKANGAIERDLEAHGQVLLEGGPYSASVVRSAGAYEAWTESRPFLYGAPSPVLQGALDDLHRKYLAAEPR